MTIAEIAKRIEGYTDKQVAALIDNHRRLSATDRPEYAAALEERGRRRGAGLDFRKSMAAIRSAARDGRFLSYKDLADLSGASWSRVHYSIGNHLGELVEYAKLQGWPMLSAIVVNKPNVITGKMEPETLEGFIKVAKELGYPVDDDPDAFLRRQQQAVFAWAQRNDAP